MKKWCLALFAFCVVTAACGLQSNSVKYQNKASPAEEYSINEKVVTKEDFVKFLGTLKEVPGTWFCGETTRGGITGYDGKDKKGIVYEYRSVYDSGSSKNAIRSKSFYNRLKQ